MSDARRRSSNGVRYNRIARLGLCIWLAIAGTAASQPTVSFTTLVAEGLGAWTFESHNQKVVSNEYGYFLTYVYESDENLKQAKWRLVRSTDGGATFTTLFSGTQGSTPPVLETDRQGNLYLITSDGMGADASMYKLTVASNFTPVLMTVLPEGAALKFAAAIDEERGQLYYMATFGEGREPRADWPQTVWFFVVGLDGTLRSKVRLTQPGSIMVDTAADAHYPTLYVDQHSDLYAAWSTIRKCAMHYYSIHFMRSRDGGATWQKLNGTPLALPVIADPTGPTDMVNAPSENDWSPWLWNLVVKGGKIHFAYERLGAAPDPNPTMHYRRWDLVTGAEDTNEGVTPVWSGSSISLRNLDGFWATRAERQDGTVYAVSRTDDNRLGVLTSTDNGGSWQDYAASPVLTGQALYAVGGARQIAHGGYILGTYTDSNGRTVIDPVTGTCVIRHDVCAKYGAVRFFKVPVPTVGELRLPATVRTNAADPAYPASYAGDGNPATQWVASLTPDFANNNAWIELDLGSVKDVQRVRWTGAQWDPHPAHSPAHYVIDASSDGVHWTRVATRAYGVAVAAGYEHVALNARYLRLTTTKVNDGTGWSLSFFEFWAEGTHLPATTRLPATVTTSTSASGYPPSHANDGTVATLWLASLTPGPANNNAWIELDLFSVKPIARLKWYGGIGVAPYPSHAPADYRIEVSNDRVSWVRVSSRTTAAGVLAGDELVDVSARYIRLVSTKVNDGSGWALSFYEFWAEG